MTGLDTPKHSMNLRERRRLLELYVDTLACFQMLLLATTSSALSTPQARERWKVKHTAGVVHTTATPLLVTQHNTVLAHCELTCSLLLVERQLLTMLVCPIDTSSTSPEYVVCPHRLPQLSNPLQPQGVPLMAPAL